jgi:Fe2+ or Zn2+ uptake regulation protein
MRYSRQREMIWQAVAQRPVHLTADQVYRAVRAKDPKVSLGTVYRNLNQLVNAGELVRIPVADGKDHFDCNVSRHYHLHCTQCGAFADLPQSVTEGLSELLCLIDRQTGMNVNPDRIQLEGLCESCSKKQEIITKTEKTIGISS